MAFISFFSFMIGTVLLLTADKGDYGRKWLAICNYCASLGAFSNVLESDTIYTFNILGIESEAVYLFVSRLAVYFQFFGQTVAPYACLMYAIVFAQIASKRARQYLSWVLLTPILLMVILAFPELVVNFKLLLIWCTPYYIVATYLVVKSWYIEEDKRTKRSKFNVLVIVVPLWLGVYFFNNVPAVLTNDNKLYLVLPIIFGAGYLLFVVYMFLSGVFGLKVKVEQQALDRSLQIMSSGTAVLNHTIKNEIHKIKFFTLIAKGAVDKEDLPEAKQAIDSVLPSIDHIDDMVDRIKAQTEEIVLKKRCCSMNEIIHKAVDGFETITRSQGIMIEVLCEGELELECDDVLIKEVLKNLLNNAVEAIHAQRGESGRIILSMEQVKWGIILKVEDNGCGIPEEEKGRILEPFFSTKRNPKNHGLGLSFCYNVMRAHEGTVAVQSEEGRGTEVTLRFPVKIVRKD